MVDVSTTEPPRIILVAPNISEVMGGEAIKALRIFQEMVNLGFDVHQITHERVRSEISQRYPSLDVRYVADSWFQVLLDKSHRLKFILGTLNAWQLNRAARQYAKKIDAWLVHFTSPISPVLPYFSFSKFPVVIGPLNGNIFHPPALSHRERRQRSRAILPIVQRVLGYMFWGKKRAAALLVAGGDRTVQSLRWAGCRDEQMFASLDSGVSNELEDFPLIEHAGRNARFVFAGRFIDWKGCDLAIRALALADDDIQLDLIGEGPELTTLQELASMLGISSRVRFLGWIPGGESLFEALRSYRGLIFPSLAEANGMIVQEAMMIGLPVVCVDWGGPGLLLNDEAAYLLRPDGEETIIDGIAHAINQLASDPVTATRLGANARAIAARDGFAWRSLITAWSKVYDKIIAPEGRSVSAWLAR